MEGGSSIVARLLQRGKGGIPSTVHQEYAMDLSATRERQSKSDNSRDEIGSPVLANEESIEALRCGACSFTAESTPDLFRHKQYCHDQAQSKISAIEIKPSKSISIFEATPQNTESIRRAGSAESPSLRELLRRKEQTRGGSAYLRSIVKVVIGNKDKSQYDTPNIQLSKCHQQNSCPADNRKQQPGKISRKRTRSDSSPGNTTPKEFLEKDWKGQENRTLKKDETSSCDFDMTIVKEEPKWGDEVSYKHDANDCRDIPEVVKGFRYRKWKRKQKCCADVNGSLVTAGQDTDKTEENLPASVADSKARSNSIVTSTFENKAIQCNLWQDGSGGHSHTTNSKNKDGQLNMTLHNSHACLYCDIYFFDEVLHSIHMGCHNLKDPFLCNVCGRHCEDKYGFYTHIMRGHQQTAE